MLDTGKYILEGKRPVKCYDLTEWCKFVENNNRIVKQTHLGKVLISTVFLGLDHRFTGEGPPILFETMIFGGTHNDYQVRYTTWKAAEAGHKRAVDLVRSEKVLK